MKSQFKINDVVEVSKPLEDASNLFNIGKLISIVEREGSFNSPLWKIKMDNGSIDYCEENFLMRTAKKIEKTS